RPERTGVSIGKVNLDPVTGIMPTLIMPTIVQQPPCLQSTHSAPSAAVPGWRAPARRQCGYQVDKKCHLLLMRVGLIWPAVISTNFFCETATPISGENRSLGGPAGHLISFWHGSCFGFVSPTAI